MECVPTTIKSLLIFLWRRDFDTSPKDKPLTPNCASSIFKTKASLSCYTDAIFFNFRFNGVTFALHDVCSQSSDSTK